MAGPGSARDGGPVDARGSRRLPQGERADIAPAAPPRPAAVRRRIGTPQARGSRAAAQLAGESGERRDWGSGSIYPTAKGWRVAVRYGRSADGRYLRKEWQFRDEAAARAKIAELEQRAGRGLPAEERRVTLSAYADEWLVAVKPSVRPSTFAFFESLARNHLDDLRLAGPTGLDAAAEALGIVGAQLRAHPDLVTRERLTLAPARLLAIVSAYRAAWNRPVTKRLTQTVAESLGITASAVRSSVDAFEARTGLTFWEWMDAFDLAEERGWEIDSRWLPEDDAYRSMPTVLYRHFDAHARLLYVGITAKNAQAARNSAHQKRSRWWPEVRSSTFEEFPDRASARAAETRAIRAEFPLHNVRA